MKRQVRSPGYNYSFDDETGLFVRWGNTLEEDPDFSPLGPEIADIEISTICHNNCEACYKTNTARGHNMSLATFKDIFLKLPMNLTQIAFGIGDIDANPDLYKIFEYCRDNPIHEVVPNITINGERLSKEDIDNLARLCGAVAVSNYNFDSCFNAVSALYKAGLKQVNIHQILSEETYPICMELLKLAHEDKRLAGLNAIVFLLLKPKGKRNHLHTLRDPLFFRNLIDYAYENSIGIGFDSCSAPLVFDSLRGSQREESISKLIEPCESTCFSIYINSQGISYPCSFTEGEEGYEGVDLLRIDDFMSQAWNNSPLSVFRTKLLENKRNCPVFDLKKREKKCPIECLHGMVETNNMSD
jgi:MoaA/NifB/PqqE/SkfB family radical SAM enzyme